MAGAFEGLYWAAWPGEGGLSAFSGVADELHMSKKDTFRGRAVAFVYGNEHGVVALCMEESLLCAR
jgi:hypothetical protein